MAATTTCGWRLGQRHGSWTSAQSSEARHPSRLRSRSREDAADDAPGMAAATRSGAGDRFGECRWSAEAVMDWPCC